MQLLNLFSGEQFSFPVNRWLAWDQADGEISVELPVLHQGQPVLPGKHNTTSAKSDHKKMLLEIVISFHQSLYHFFFAVICFLCCFLVVIGYGQIKG